MHEKHEPKKRRLTFAQIQKLIRVGVVIGAAIATLSQYTRKSKTAELEQELLDQKATIKVLVQNCTFAGHCPTLRGQPTNKTFETVGDSQSSALPPRLILPQPTRPGEVIEALCSDGQLQGKLCEGTK